MSAYLCNCNLQYKILILIFFFLTFFSSCRSIQRYFGCTQTPDENGRTKRIIQRCWTSFSSSISGKCLLFHGLRSCHVCSEQISALICCHRIRLWTFSFLKTCASYINCQHISIIFWDDIAPKRGPRVTDLQ